MGEKKKVKYLVPLNSFVTVNIYVDTSNPDVPRALSIEEEANLPHILPAGTDLKVYDASKNDSPEVVSKKFSDKVKFLSTCPIDTAKLPENIVVEWSKWAKPTWGIHSWIDEQSYFRKSPDPRVGKEFDLMRFMRARVRALLVDWSLSESDPGLKLSLVPETLSDGTPVQVLNTASLLAVAQCNPEIVTAFYAKAVSVLYPTAEETKN